MKITIDFFARSKNKRKYLGLVQELREYSNKQVQLYLEGEQSTPQRIANACLLMEEGCYMREYVSNEDGRIAEIHFEKVQDKKDR